MYYIEVHKEVQRMISIFHFFGIWQHTDHRRFRKWCLWSWYLGAYAYFVVALVIESATADSEDEMVFLASTAIGVFILEVRLYCFMWSKDEILGFIRKMGEHAIQYEEEYRRVNEKINSLIKFVSFYEIMLFCAACTLSIAALPWFSSDSNEKRLPVNYYIPFDWHENVVLYALAYAFVIYAALFSSLCALFNSMIWYLMLSCGIKYQTLGNEFRSIGLDGEDGTVAVAGNQRRFLLNLIRLIKKHKELEETTYQFKIFFSNIFFIQIATSGLGICGFVYALSFSSIGMANPFLYAVHITTIAYSFFDIFMVTYYGNEIKFASSKLAYCVYESNWIEQSRSCKLCMLILEEVLKKPQVLVIGKIYALDLEVFTNILRFSYSMFNILKKLQR